MQPISTATRIAFREFCSGWLVLRTIGEAFEAHGFQPDGNAPVQVGGQRRGYVEEFYTNIDWESPDHTRRFLHVIEDALELAASDNHDRAAVLDDLGRLTKALHRDGFTLDVETLTIDQHAPLAITELVPDQLLQPGVLQRYVTEMRQTADSKPASAIDAAKNLIEATSKLVLDELEIGYARSPKLPGLLAQVQDALGLHAKDVAADTTAAADIRQILGGLLQVGLGLGELRNHYGDGHGRTDLPKGLKPRHAYLAIGAADTYARFILATLAERRDKL